MVRLFKLVLLLLVIIISFLEMFYTCKSELKLIIIKTSNISKKIELKKINSVVTVFILFWILTET